MSDCELISGWWAQWVAMRRSTGSAFFGCGGCAAQNGDVRAAESG